MRKSQRLSLIIGLLLSISNVFIYAQGTYFAHRAKLFFADENLQPASYALVLMDAKTGEELFVLNPDLALVPASTLKLVTTLTVLQKLGADFRYNTQLQARGVVHQNQLYGDLIIAGSGDPSLGSCTLSDSLCLSRVFAYWYEQLQQKGIMAINGNIIADGSCFDNQAVPPKWLWEDLGNYYGAGAHGITVNENLFTLYFEPGSAVGHPARILETYPDIPGLEFINEVRTGALRSGDNVYIYGAPYQAQRWLTGTVPLMEDRFEVRGSIPDPAQFMAETFKRYLIQNGIKIQGAAYTHHNPPYPFEKKASYWHIASWQSPALYHLTHRTNSNSVNTYAENLLKTLALTKYSQGTYAKGLEVVMEHWRAQGVNTQGMRLFDGSGLSPRNTITARQLTQMLYIAANDSLIANYFIEGLPLAGRSGTLINALRNTPSEGVLRAKTGSLGHVRAFSGYTVNSQGRHIAFTFIINHFEGPAAPLRTKMLQLLNDITISDY